MTIPPKPDHKTDLRGYRSWMWRYSPTKEVQKDKHYNRNKKYRSSPSYKQKKNEYQRTQRAKRKIEDPVGYKLSIRRANIKRYHGITLEKYTNMIQSQDYKCKICSARLNGDSKTHLDHCHVTGRLRAMLCTNCNTGLGAFRDNITNLQQAITYLQSYQ
jgi:hypothetical protein